MDEDYPKAFEELEARDTTDAACLEYLAALRWPAGFVCPSCGGTQAWDTTRALQHRRQCGTQTSVTAGTLFHRTRLPLPLATHLYRASGADLEIVQEQLGHASIKTTTIYAKVTKEDKARAAEALAWPFGSRNRIVHLVRVGLDDDLEVPKFRREVLRVLTHVLSTTEFLATAWPIREPP